MLVVGTRDPPDPGNRVSPIAKRHQIPTIQIACVTEYAGTSARVRYQKPTGEVSGALHGRPSAQRCPHHVRSVAFSSLVIR